jgi:hypothetical protein
MLRSFAVRWQRELFDEISLAESDAGTEVGGGGIASAASAHGSVNGSAAGGAAASTPARSVFRLDADDLRLLEEALHRHEADLHRNGP